MEKLFEYFEQNKKDEPLLLIMSAYSLINQALVHKGYKEGVDYIDINKFIIYEDINGRNLLKMIKI